MYPMRLGINRNTLEGVVVVTVIFVVIVAVIAAVIAPVTVWATP